MKICVSYPLDQCALFAITSPAMLANRLRVPLGELEELANLGNNYRIWNEEKPSGGQRLIEEPKPKLQALHERVHKLLSRVELPDYVHSVRRGRSYITNAREHQGPGSLVKIDVEKFYLSVRSGAVASFFQHQMRCALDVAALLARLLTREGHLPTGSKSSPILSYFAHREMFDAIAAYAAERGLKMTLYVDDMAISGLNAHRGVLSAIRKIIAAHGLRSHKLQHFGPKRPKVVTGTVVTPTGLRLPNRRQKRIKEGYSELHAATTPTAKLDVLNRLGSLVHEAAQIDPKHRPSAVQLDALRRQLKRQIASGIVSSSL